MGQAPKPWTSAIQTFLSDGDWHTESDALTEGAKHVDDDRVRKELNLDEDALIPEGQSDTARRNVAKQSMTGFKRFGKIQYRHTDGVKEVCWISDDSTALGPVAEIQRAMRGELDQLKLEVEALRSTVDFLEQKAAPTYNGPVYEESSQPQDAHPLFSPTQ